MERKKKRKKSEVRKRQKEDFFKPKEETNGRIAKGQKEKDMTKKVQ